MSVIGVEGTLASCTVSSVVPPPLALRAHPRAIPLDEDSLSSTISESGARSPSTELRDERLIDVFAIVGSKSVTLELLPSDAGLREGLSAK